MVGRYAPLGFQKSSLAPQRVTYVAVRAPARTRFSDSVQPEPQASAIVRSTCALCGLRRKGPAQRTPTTVPSTTHAVFLVSWRGPPTLGKLMQWGPCHGSQVVVAPKLHNIQLGVWRAAARSARYNVFRGWRDLWGPSGALRPTSEEATCRCFCYLCVVYGCFRSGACAWRWHYARCGRCPDGRERRASVWSEWTSVGAVRRTYAAICSYTPRSNSASCRCRLVYVPCHVVGGMPLTTDQPDAHVRRNCRHSSPPSTWPMEGTQTVRPIRGTRPSVCCH